MDQIGQGIFEGTFFHCIHVLGYKICLLKMKSWNLDYKKKGHFNFKSEIGHIHNPRTTSDTLDPVTTIVLRFNFYGGDTYSYKVELFVNIN